MFCKSQHKEQRRAPQREQTLLCPRLDSRKGIEQSFWTSPAFGQLNSSACFEEILDKGTSGGALHIQVWCPCGQPRISPFPIWPSADAQKSSPSEPANTGTCLRPPLAPQPSPNVCVGPAVPQVEQSPGAQSPHRAHLQHEEPGDQGCPQETDEIKFFRRNELPNFYIRLIMWLIKGTAPILMYFWVLSFLALFCFGFSVYFICGFILLMLSTKMSLGF